MSSPTGGQADVPRSVIDTMIASAILLGPRRPWAMDLLERYGSHLRGVSVVLSFTTVSELRYGSLKGNFGAARVARMEEWFRNVASVVMPDNDLVNTCANLRHECQRRALALHEKIHESDRWIAATALRHNLPLISDDKVFRETPGLHLIQVLQPDTLA